MSKFTLEIEFTPQQLTRIYESNSRVIIAKPTGGSTVTDVAWQAFKPLENNQITWEEKYGIYASCASIEHGATLYQMSETDLVVEEKDYDLNWKGFFEAKTLETPAEPGAYYATNDYREKESLVMGLFQHAEVNGELQEAHAISAAPVLRGSTIQMTPYTVLKVWIQSDLVGNSVVSHVTSPQATVEFGGGVYQSTLSFDSSSGHFLAPVA